MNFKPAGIATGIGSMPFTEPQEALGLIFEKLPRIPHWPQLPQRGGQEGFVFQFLNPLVRTGLLTVQGDRVFFNTEHTAWPQRLADFYTLYLEAEEGNPQALSYFAFPQEAAAGFYAFGQEVIRRGTEEILFLKGQLAGPLTVGFQLKDEQGRLAYYNEQLRDLLVKALALHARWQAEKLAEHGRPVIVFVDEPAISVYGQFSFITVTREMIQHDLDAIVGAIHAAGALAGVHSCDAIDWSILYESELEIVNLDAYNYGNSLLPYAREMKVFLNRGGIIAWGIVPTSENAFEEDKDSLLERLYDYWLELEKRGITRELLQQQAMITPACGTGLLSHELTRRIYDLTQAISEEVRR